MTLESIRRQLIMLRECPEHDEAIFAESASLLNSANTLAAMQGIDVEWVGTVCRPIVAITVVSRYINSIQAEWITVPEAASLIGVSQAKVAEWIREKRLDAVNVANKGKRACYRINRIALNQIKPEPPKRQSRKIISDGGIDI